MRGRGRRGLNPVTSAGKAGRGERAQGNTVTAQERQRPPGEDGGWPASSRAAGAGAAARRRRRGEQMARAGTAPVAQGEGLGATTRSLSRLLQ